MFLDGLVSGELCPGMTFDTAGMKVLRRRSRDSEPFVSSSGPLLKAEGVYGGKKFVLVKPATFMNESGIAVEYLVRKGIVRDAEDLLVVVDDVNLDIGRVRFRSKGSSGGQKGLQNIIDRLGTNEFSRLRIGVGPRPDGSELTDYVLATFSPDEKHFFGRALRTAANCVAGWIEGDVEKAQAALNEQ